jgi:hypothetical protein
MPLKFRLRGLAETFVDNIQCCNCGHDGGDDGDQAFKTEHTRVTYAGIIVVIECEVCGHVFVPDNQRRGVLNSGKLRSAVEKDSENTGQPIFQGVDAVKLEVERINAEIGSNIH